MLTSKQKVYLRSLAQNLKPCVQIGKNGLSENLKTDVLNYLKKYELVKVSILNNSMVTFAEAKDFFEESAIEVVQKIGHTLVLYQTSGDAKNPIILP